MSYSVKPSPISDPRLQRSTPGGAAGNEAGVQQPLHFSGDEPKAKEKTSGTSWGKRLLLGMAALMPALGLVGCDTANQAPPPPVRLTNFRVDVSNPDVHFVYGKSGQAIGAFADNGVILDVGNRVLGTTDHEYNVYVKDNKVGRIGENGEIFAIGTKDGKTEEFQVGSIAADGTVTNFAGVTLDKLESKELNRRDLGALAMVTVIFNHMDGAARQALAQPAPPAAPMEQTQNNGQPPVVVVNNGPSAADMYLRYMMWDSIFTPYRTYYVNPIPYPVYTQTYTTHIIHDSTQIRRFTDNGSRTAPQSYQTPRVERYRSAQEEAIRIANQNTRNTYRPSPSPSWFTPSSSSPSSSSPSYRPSPSSSSPSYRPSPSSSSSIFRPSPSSSSPSYRPSPSSSSPSYRPSPSSSSPSYRPSPSSSSPSYRPSPSSSPSFRPSPSPSSFSPSS